MAVIAASWRTSAHRQLSGSLLEELTRPGATVGEAFLAAKRQSKRQDFIHMYNLLGDPAVPLAIPEPLTAVAIESGEVPTLVASLEAARVGTCPL